MKLRDRSLELGDGDPAERRGAWTIVSDLAMSLVVVLVLFVLAQFLHYDSVFTLEEIDRRRAVVEDAVRLATDSLIGPGMVLEVVNQGFSGQRIRFPEAMLFVPCGTVPRIEGVRLIEAVGRAIGETADYFESIQIEGHADRMQPSGDCELLVRDNWGLSSARATAFVRVLVQPDVFPHESLVSAVGRGDTQPLTDSGVSVDQLERDRRVELNLAYSEENARNAVRADYDRNR